MDKFFGGWKKIMIAGKFALLPILAGIFPVMFYYSNNLSNLGILPFSQLGDLFTILFLIALGMFLFFCLVSKGKLLLASMAGLIFVILFNLYGIAFSWLRSEDFIQVDHYLFFPFFLLLAIYLAWMVGKLLTSNQSVVPWNVCMIIVCSLIAINAGKIALDAVKKAEAKSAGVTEIVPVANESNNEHPPDIYYFIFDEFAGFDAMRKYWKYDQIDTLVDFLKNDGFFVAENSHSGAPSTLFELSSRLNYGHTFSKTEDNEVYYEAISHNQAMQFLKSHGYTTVTFDGLYYAWPARQPIQADISLEPAEAYTGGFLNNEFEILVLRNTMVLPFLYNEKQDDPVAVRNRSMIYFTLERISQLSDIPSPKFVFIHLMAPHSPFLFTAEGDPQDPQHYRDWNSYLGNYIYTTKIIQNLVSSILAASDPSYPPVIILQSDHGARNGTDNYINNLKNYPGEYRNLIMNAQYLPGCDTSALTQDVKPVNTLPIVFNCYFNANIPLK